MNQKFLDFIRKYDGKPMALGVSGGVDSMCLLYWLHEIGANITCLHVNHQLRPQADIETEYVKSVCEKLNIPCHIFYWNDDKPTKGLEAAAREVRYQMMTDFCHENNIEYLLTAHQSDDQIETFLLNLARGSGLDGLCAMPKKNTIDGVNVIRPMLNLTKQNCRDYLIHLGVKWCEDESNKDIKYKRNKIRYLINQIEDKDILVKRIANTIEILQEVRETIDDLIDRMDKKIIKYDKNSAFFNKNDLLVLTKYLQKSLITKCILKLAGKEYKPRLYQIENIITSITEEKDFKRTIMNLIIKKKGDIVEIYKMKKI